MELGGKARPGTRRSRLLLGSVLIAAGALLLILPAAHVATGWRAQATRVSTGSGRASLTLARPPRRLQEGEALGRLEVPRLGLDLVVFEGTSESTLRKGPGHLRGTVWPEANEAGNCVIAGHRDSFFRRLADAREDDLVLLRRPSGTSTYRLQKRRVVRPEDLSVIAPTAEARLTLITCFPFRWIGSAPYRLVWSAAPIDSEWRVTRPLRERASSGARHPRP